MRQEKEDQENDRNVQNPRPVIRGSLPARLLALSLQGLELLCLLCSHCKLRAQSEPTEEQGKVRWQLTKKRHHHDATTLKDLLGLVRLIVGPSRFIWPDWKWPTWLDTSRKWGRVEFYELWIWFKTETVSCSIVSNSLQPHGIWLTRLLCPWDSPGKNIGVGYHFLLRGIFRTQRSNPGLLHHRKILYHLSPRKLGLGLGTL